MTGAVPGVAARRANFLIGAAPVAQPLLGEGAIVLECRPEFDPRDLGLRIENTRAAGTLRDGGTGKQKRRQSKKKSSHSSLDIDVRARRARAARALKPHGAHRLSQTLESERRSVEAVRLNTERRELREKVRCVRRRRQDRKTSGARNAGGGRAAMHALAAFVSISASGLVRL